MDKFPGIRYGELLRVSGLTNGALEYHMKILESTNKVKVNRPVGRRARYYPLGIQTDNSHILGYIRNTAARQIVIFVLEHDMCAFGEIVVHMNKAPSTISWHLKRLSEAGIISITHGEAFPLYGILRPKLVASVLNEYRETFGDKVANQYNDMFWDL